MKLIVSVLPGDPPCHLHLEPESDADRKTLEKLLERGLTCGFGREPITNALLHVQVTLESRGEKLRIERKDADRDFGLSDCSSAIDRCFCCGTQFDQSYVDGFRDWPGTIFDATGNWGSTIFDPSPSERPAFLRIRVCDRCVIQKRDRIEETGNSLAHDLREDVMQFFERR